VRACCLINNYNYARFVAAAVDSALDQERPFDEIVVIDDGSTDDSLGRLRERFSYNPQVRILSQPNQGQLSCFENGWKATQAEIVCFLDADDVYHPEYLSRLLAVYESQPEYDFVYCHHRKFDAVEEPAEIRPDVAHGYSAVLTWFTRAWIGGPTSCLSMRRELLDRILPLGDWKSWKTRADDCLVMGASLAGARKYFLGQPLVGYRIHANNHFHGRKFDSGAAFRRRLALCRVFDTLAGRMGYDPASLADLAHREFRTHASPSWKLMRQYARSCPAAQVGWLRKLSILGSLLAWRLANRRGRSAMPAPAASRCEALPLASWQPGRARRAA